MTAPDPRVFPTPPGIPFTGPIPTPPGVSQDGGGDALLEALIRSSLATQNAVTQLVGVAARTEQQRETQQGYRQLKPKREVSSITAASAY